MRRLLLCCLLVAGLAGCEAGLDAPAEITLQTRKAVEVLPADAQFVARLDVDAVQRNATLDLFAEQGPWLGKVSGELPARLRDFVEATGFDPREDVREVYVAATGSEHAAPSLVVYADYDRERLEAYMGAQMADDFTRDAYRGVPVYRSRTHEGHALFFALATDDMIVASPEEPSMQAMLDRLAGQGTGLSADEGTMRLIRQVGGGDAWVVARHLRQHVRPVSHPDAGGTPTGGTQVDLVREDLLEDVAVSLRIDADGVEGDAWLTPAEGVSTDDVAALVEGAVAAMKTTTELDAPRLRALDDVDVRTAGRDVRVSFAADNEALRHDR